MTGLTAPAASGICMNHCKAMCCRGSLILELTPNDIDSFKGHASEFGVEVEVAGSPDRGGWARFADHQGKHCPMLDDATSACRVDQRAAPALPRLPREAYSQLRHIRVAGEGDGN